MAFIGCHGCTAHCTLNFVQCSHRLIQLKHLVRTNINNMLLKSLITCIFCCWTSWSSYLLLASWSWYSVFSLACLFSSSRYFLRCSPSTLFCSIFNCSIVASYSFTLTCCSCCLVISCCWESCRASLANLEDSRSFAAFAALSKAVESKL